MDSFLFILVLKPLRYRLRNENLFPVPFSRSQREQGDETRAMSQQWQQHSKALLYHDSSADKALEPLDVYTVAVWHYPVPKAARAVTEAGCAQEPDWAVLEMHHLTNTAPLQSQQGVSHSSERVVLTCQPSALPKPGPRALPHCWFSLNCAVGQVRRGAGQVAARVTPHPGREHRRHMRSHIIWAMPYLFLMDSIDVFFLLLLTSCKPCFSLHLPFFHCFCYNWRAKQNGKCGWEPARAACSDCQSFSNGLKLLA